MLSLFALAAAATPPPPCPANQLSLDTDGMGGSFNGMSHSGTLVVLRNLGTTTCTVAGLPAISFLDAKGHALPIERSVPKGLHPGPAIAPVAVPAGAELTTALRWVSGPVFDRSRCLHPTSIRVRIGDTDVRSPFKATICGESGAPATFQQKALQRDPTLADAQRAG